jgi:hypothetical protein
MDNFNDFKSIWLTTKTAGLPAADDMLHIIKHYRNTTLQRKLMVILTATVSVTILIGITFIYKAKMQTTRIGQYSFILAGCVLILANVRSIKGFYDLQDFSNIDFIKFLERSRQNQIYFYKKTQVAGLALWSAGLLFYIFQFVYQNVFLGIAAYSFAIIFLIVLWIVVRRRVFNKRANKMEEMIKRIKSLSNQF